MSSAKFAAITAILLARKGDDVRCCACHASAAPGAGPARRAAHSFRTAATRERRKAASHCGFHPQDELERLSIAAIKKGANRHDIVRAALNNYFCKLSRNSRNPVPAWKAVLPFWRGTPNPTAGRITIRIPPAPKTSLRQVVMMTTAENGS